MIINVSNILVLLVVSLLSCATAAQGSGSFCTAIPGNEAMPLDLSNVKGIRLGRVREPSKKYVPAVFAPRTVNWHVYSLPEGNDEGKIAMSPANLVQPQLSGDGGSLQFRFTDEFNEINENDDVQAGIALWLPEKYIATLDVSGVTATDMMVVFYNGTSPMTVSHRGDGNTIVIHSSQAPVFYQAIVDETYAAIFATGAGGSSLDLMGDVASVDIKVADATNTPSQGRNASMAESLLQVGLIGQGSFVRIDGAYESMYMTGPGAQSEVNTNCNNVKVLNTSASCVVDLNLTVSDDFEVSCLSVTNVVPIIPPRLSTPSPSVIIGVAALVGIMVVGVGGVVVWLKSRSNSKMEKEGNEVYQKECEVETIADGIDDEGSDIYGKGNTPSAPTDSFVAAAVI